MSRRNAAILCALALTIATAGEADTRNERVQKRYEVTRHEIDLPDVMLRDMHGNAVPLRSALAADEPVLLNFIFTSCPSICPLLSAIFRQTQDLLGPEMSSLRMVSISIDPEQDTPQRLREYALKFKAGGEWTFYTGNVDDIVEVQKAFDVFRGNKMNHEPYTFIRASAQRPWVRIDGFLSARDLVAEYRSASGR